MVDSPRFIRGAPALIFLLSVGAASLFLTARQMVRHGQPQDAALFAFGLACGYAAPLTFRIGRLIGRDRLAQLVSVRVGLLCLFFLALLVPLIVGLRVQSGGGPLIGGTLTMLTLGMGLQDD